MYFDKQKWLDVLKSKKVKLAREEEKYIKKILYKAESFYRVELNTKAKQSRRTLLTVGRLIDHNQTLQQAIVNLKQDINRLRFMKTHTT